MNKLNFKISLLFALLAYAVHHFEENIIFDFRAWRLQYFSDNNALSTEAVFVILTAVTLTSIITHMIVENKASAQSVIMLLMATQVNNVIFHAGGTIVFSHFSPGLITGILLYIPVNIVISYKAFQEGWVSKRSLVILFLIGGLVFWAFEQIGPLPMVTVLVAAYIWIAYETIKNVKSLNKS
jgi:hypothetical protein